jgi:hypothetical protein
LSILALRTRAIRYWMAGVGLLVFGVAYAAPVALAVRMQPRHVPLPLVGVPAVGFPSLSPPKV